MKYFLAFLLVVSYSYSADNYKEMGSKGSSVRYTYDSKKCCDMPKPINASDKILIEWVKGHKSKINQSNGPVSDLPDSSKNNIYYGCNLILTDMDKWLLGFIKRKMLFPYDIKNIHVLGCGYGNMLVPLIIATKKKSSDVKIFASDLNSKNIERAKGLFTDSANGVDIRKIEQNRLSFSTLDINNLPNGMQCDFTIVRNVLHFLLEDQIEKFAKGIFKKTSAGGYLYFSVQLPSNSVEYIKHVREQQKLGNKDPGFIKAKGYNFYLNLSDESMQILKRVMGYIGSNLDLQLGIINKDVVISDISRANHGSTPGYQTPYSKKVAVEPGSTIESISKGVINEKNLAICKTINKANGIDYTSTEFVQTSYLPETIVPIFTKNGWQPLTVSYINYDGNIVNYPNDEELSKSSYYMYVLLQKPGASKGTSCAKESRGNKRNKRGRGKHNRRK